MAISMADIKNAIKQSSADRGKFLFFKDGTEYRVRFLNDLLEGTMVMWHYKYDKQDTINVPCQEVFGRECQYCDDEDLKAKERYCWSVYDYESGEVKLILTAINRCSPVPAMTDAYETYGTLTDRDYKIKQIGNGTSKTFSLLPVGDVKQMKNKKIKPLSEEAILKYIDKAYPADNNELEDEEETSKKNRSKNIGKGKNKYMNEPEEQDEEWEEEETGYELMKPQELWKLCKERDIDCKPKKSKQYYIDLLEQADAEEQDEEWEEDEELPFH